MTASSTRPPTEPLHLPAMEPSAPALGRGEEWLRHLAEGMGDAVFWVNDLRAGRVLYVSPAYRRLWGLDPAELYADPLAHRRLVHPDDRARTEAAYEAGAATGHFDEEYRLVLPSGDVRWVRDRGYPIVGRRGAERVAGIAEDVTDRKRREERMAGLQALTAALSGAVGRDQVAEIVVARARPVLGADRGVVAVLAPGGRELVTLRSDGYPAAVAAGFARYPVDPSTMAGAAVGRREPVFVETATERTARFPHLAALAGAGVALPLLVDGRPIGALGFGFPADRPIAAEERDFLRAVADLCAQALERARLFDAERQARLRAEAAEARLRTTFEHAAVGVAHLDLDGRWLRVNRRLCEIVGYDEAELLARTWQEMTYGPDLEADLANVRRLLAGEIPSFSMEKRYVRKDGSLVWVQITPTLAHPADESPYFIVVIEDISARKALEGVQEEFLASASHDLKNPLGAIKGQAQVLRRRLGRGELDPARFGAGLDAIDAGATRMTALIDDIGDAARLRTGQPLEMHHGPMDLVGLVRRVADDYQRTTERHAIRVAADPPSLVGVWDERRLERVLANLLSNAVKYSPAGGAVTLRVAREDGEGGPWAVVSVADRGVGIPAADLPHLFARHRRGTNVGGIAGSGVGLFGVRRIVEQHGGTVAIASEEGAGTTVTVRLPLDSATA